MSWISHGQVKARGHTLNFVHYALAMRWYRKTQFHSHRSVLAQQFGVGNIFVVYYNLEIYVYSPHIPQPLPAARPNHYRT